MNNTSIASQTIPLQWFSFQITITRFTSPMVGCIVFVTSGLFEHVICSWDDQYLLQSRPPGVTWSNKLVVVIWNFVQLMIHYLLKTMIQLQWRHILNINVKWALIFVQQYDSNLLCISYLHVFERNTLCQIFSFQRKIHPVLREV